MLTIVAIVGTLAALTCAPLLAARVMRLSGGLGKSAVTAFVTLGLMQIIAMLAGHLGPLGGIIGFMASLAAWYPVVKVIYGTDTAQTIVFMFWHLFFLLLSISLLSLVVGQSLFGYAFPLLA